MRSLRSGVLGLCLTCILLPAAMAGWTYSERHSYGSGWYVDNGASPASYMNMSISAYGFGVAGTSIASADFPYSQSRDMGVYGWTEETWTWTPEPGEPPRGEIEFQGDLWVECLAAVPAGKESARSYGWIELEIKVDGAIIYREDVEVDLARVTSESDLGTIGGSVGPPGLKLGGAISVNTVRGNGVSSGEDRETVPSSAVCGVSFVRTSRSKARHTLSIDWMLHLWKISKANADTLGVVHWDWWEPLVGCPGE